MLGDGTIDKGSDVARVEGNGLIEITDCLAVLSLPDKQNAAIEIGLDVSWIELQCAVVIAERAFAITFVFARYAAIEIRLIKLWVEGDREGKILDGFFDLALFLAIDCRVQGMTKPSPRASFAHSR